jgi:hypothetical protein
MIPPPLASQMAADHLRERRLESARAAIGRKPRSRRVAHRAGVRTGELLIALGRRLAPDDRGVTAERARHERGTAPA